MGGHNEGGLWMAKGKKQGGIGAGERRGGEERGEEEAEESKNKK